MTSSLEARLAPAALPRVALIAAAGSGSRMGAAIPKQYLQLGGKAVLQHTLERVFEWPGLSHVVVVLADDDEYFDQLPASADTRIQRVIGGASRAASVLAGLRHIAADSAMQSVQTAHSQTHNPWILVHDAARPLVATADVESLFREVFAGDACGGILATPVADTLKRAERDSQRSAPGIAIETTVARAGLWAAQTPQLFRLRELTTALQQADDADLAVTDEASAMEMAGHHPLLVHARGLNIKLTTQADLELAQAILASLNS